MARRSLSGKVILITGGARGIGAAGAAELQRRGARPVLADVDRTTLAAKAAELGCDSVAMDVTDFAGCQQAVADVLERHGRLDAVWANAGIAVDAPLELVPPQLWARTVEVNLIGAFHTVRAALPSIIDSRGYVAITASLASFIHPPLFSAYSASKAGVEAMANSLRVEVKHLGVDVGTFHPSWIDTDMVREGWAHRAYQRLREATPPPFNRTHSVHEIVPAIADAFGRRSRRVYLPPYVRAAHVLRPAAHTRAVQREMLKAAPEMRADFLRDTAEKGADRAALGDRYLG